MQRRLAAGLAPTMAAPPSVWPLNRHDVACRKPWPDSDGNGRPGVGMWSDELGGPRILVVLCPSRPETQNISFPPLLAISPSPPPPGNKCPVWREPLWCVCLLVIRACAHSRACAVLPSCLSAHASCGYSITTTLLVTVLYCTVRSFLSSHASLPTCTLASLYREQE